MKLEFNRRFESNSQCSKRHLCGNYMIVIHLSLGLHLLRRRRLFANDLQTQNENIHSETMQKEATKIITTMNIKCKIAWNI